MTGGYVPGSAECRHGEHVSYCEICSPKQKSSLEKAKKLAQDLRADMFFVSLTREDQAKEVLQKTIICVHNSIPISSFNNLFVGH